MNDNERAFEDWFETQVYPYQDEKYVAKKRLEYWHVWQAAQSQPVQFKIGLAGPLKLEAQSQPVPCLCPVCLGKGIVPGGFYSSLPGCPTVSTSLSEKCRQCDGRGILPSVPPAQSHPSRERELVEVWECRVCGLPCRFEIFARGSSDDLPRKTRFNYQACPCKEPVITDWKRVDALSTAAKEPARDDNCQPCEPAKKPWGSCHGCIRLKAIGVPPVPGRE